MTPWKQAHQHTPEEERRIREAALDKTIESSFPASDPPSSIPNPDDHTMQSQRPRRRTLAIVRLAVTRRQ